VVDDSSLLRLARSGLRCLWRNFAVDTVVDLEVYSRLTTVLSSLTCARNRIGFYLETAFWRKHLHTHLIFFNRWAGSFRWYDAVARLLGAEPAAVELCQRKLRERFGWVEPSSGAARQIAIGHSCSDLGRERMLDERQWLAVFEKALGSGDRGRVLFLGTSPDRDLATRIIQGLSQRFSLVRFDNFCGDLSLADSLRTLASCHEFWGIDSALLHFARLLGLKCVSYWGPTDPMTRLRPVPGLQETVHYGKVPCSPCVHVAEEPPCRGQNVCIQCLFHPKPEYESISWTV